MTVSVTKTTLINGNPLAPSSSDIFAQLGRLDVGEPVPDGWRALTGNPLASLVARILYRYELDD